VYLPSALSGRPDNRSFKGDWPGARAGQIEGGPSNHLEGANPTDKNVVSYTKSEADYISYHAANFEENAINTTAARSQIGSVKILLADPVFSAACIVVKNIFSMAGK
jgi:hypothetical protein